MDSNELNGWNSLVMPLLLANLNEYVSNSENFYFVFYYLLLLITYYSTMQRVSDWEVIVIVPPIPDYDIINREDIIFVNIPSMVVIPNATVTLNGKKFYCI